MVEKDIFSIFPVSKNLDGAIWDKINRKIKPVGALGKLEYLAYRMASIQQSLEPVLAKPQIVLFAGDHGIAKSGLVNPYPKEVTYQMVLNFLNGRAAINVLSEEQGIAVKIVDAGVDHIFNPGYCLIDAKMGFGTKDYRFQKAMTKEACNQAISKGAEIAAKIADEKTNIIGFGEMGIGNSSSAALIMSALCDFPIQECVGRGAGADDAFLLQKTETLKKVISYHGLTKDNPPIETLTTYGGFEIAQMVGGILCAASKGMIILIDGFISTVAILVASRINPLVVDHAIFTHRSEELGHAKLLGFLEAKPILDLGMRLGEGTGCAVAYPLLRMATAFLNKMASFDDVEVSEKSDK